MTNKSQTFQLSHEQRDQILQELSRILKERVVLQQKLRQQQEQSTAYKEELFLEFLEVFDALEFLLNYLKNHPESDQQVWKGLFKFIANVERKFLNLLSKHQVHPINFQGTQPDFNLCQVVDQVARNDLEALTITEVVRKGFYIDDKVLRPIEVIVSQLDG